MKDSYKIHLQEVLKEGDVQYFRDELHNVIKKEVKAMNVPLLEINAMLDMLELVEIPLTVKSNIKYPPKDKYGKTEVAIVTASVTGTLLNSLLYKTPLIIRSFLSFGGAILAGLFVVGKHNKEKRGVIVETIETPFDEIVSIVDNLLSVIQGIITPKKVILSDSFPTILEWYQKAYSSCSEFGIDCSEYFKKRIENILRQYGYTIHNFDGTNDSMFQKVEGSEIQNPMQDLPAITSETGYILPGCLFIPKKRNN